jgi:DNA helicase-2/ATP-dependent DNA helicase PcrA
MTGKEPLIAHSERPNQKATLFTCDTVETERRMLAREIKKCITRGVAPEEIAIIYRENREAFPIATMLAKQGIPYVIESDQNVLDDNDIQKLITLMRAVCDFGNEEKFLKALHADFLSVDPLDLYKVIHTARKLRKNVYDIVRSQETLTGADITSPRLMELGTQFAQWCSGAHHGEAMELFESMVRDSGFLASVLSSPLVFEKLTKLRALYQQLEAIVESRRTVTLSEFLAHLDTLEEHQLLIKSNHSNGTAGRVRLMTAHKSKGQEFDYVFVTGLVDGKWGNRRAMDPIKLPKAVGLLSQKTTDVLEEVKNEEERNLLYVALTRPRCHVVLSYARRASDGRERLPSQFLQEMSPEYLVQEQVVLGDEDTQSMTQALFARSVPCEPTIADRKFLGELFSMRGLSVTALNNYLECPWRYFYTNLIRIPEAHNKYLMYGNAVHETLQVFFDRWNTGEHLGSDVLIRQFERELIRQPLSERDFQETLMKGKAALLGYYHEYHTTWKRQLMNELKIDGIELAPGVLINGKIDKVELLDASTHRAHVVDYKTGKPKTRGTIAGSTASSDGNYKRQLVFYKALLDRFEEGKYRVESGEINFIDPDEKGRYHREIFTLSSDEVRELEQLIMHIAEEIRSLAFWHKTCGSWECSYCSLRRMMKN